MTPSRTEAGFTLVELLVTVVISTIIIVGITAGLTVVIKTFPDDAQRLTQDEGAQLLSSWLQADVASASIIDVSGATSTCAGGPTKLKLTWTDYDYTLPSSSTTTTSSGSSPHTFEASYALAGSILTRYYCVDGGAPSRTKVGRNVQSVTATKDAAGQQASLVVTDLVNGGTYTFTVSASRRTSPTTTSTSTTSTSTTSTSTTTTTAPTTTTTAPPCTITSAAVTPSSVARASGNSGHLSQDITLSGQATGTCGPLKYSVDTGTGLQTKPLPTCASCSPPLTTWSLTIDRNTFSWTAGSHPFTIIDATSATVLGSPNPVPFSVTS